MTGVMLAARLHAGPGGQAELRLDRDVSQQPGVRRADRGRLCRVRGGPGAAVVGPARGVGLCGGGGCGGADKVQRCLAVGADFAVDHNDPTWPQKVRQFTGGRGVEIVFEHVGQATWEGSLKALGRGGRLVTCGGHSGFMVGFNLWHLLVKEHRLIGSFGGTRRDFLDVMLMAGQGDLRQVGQQVVSLADVPLAQDMLRQRKVFGKPILDPTLA